MARSKTEPPYVVVEFSSPRDRRTAEKMLALLDLLARDAMQYVPSSVRVSEWKYPFGPDFYGAIAQAWASSPPWHGLHYERKKLPRSWLNVDTQVRETRSFNRLTLGVDERQFRDPANVASLLQLARRLGEWAEAAHGYIYHWDELETRNRMANGQTGGIHLEECLPGIFWANYFGPLYVEWFGRKAFATCPAYRKEEFSDGSWLLLGSASPLDWQEPETQAMERVIQSHLEGPWSALRGAAFFDPRRPKRRYRTPRFEFQQPSRGPGQIVMVDDATEVFSEEPTDFVEGAPDVAEDLKQRFRKNASQLDYSPASLRLLDDFILARSRQDKDPQQAEDGRLLLRQLTAYYGEVLRRNLRGEWVVAKPHHPGVRLGPPDARVTEYVFVRDWKLWVERERSAGLAVGYQMLSTGDWARLERTVADLARGVEPPASE